MMKKIMKSMFLASPLAVLMLAGCTTMHDKNQPPPPVAPPAEAAAVPPAEPLPEYVPAPEPKPDMIVLEGVHFDFDKDMLKPSAVEILDHAVTVIQQYPDLQFSISGHTDSMGSDEYNDDLAQRRATIVHDYLVDHGVSSSRLGVSSHGERNPVADNSSKEGRARNRRVEIAPL